MLVGLCHGWKPVTNIEGIDSARSAKKFVDRPPNISLLGGRLLNMHIYVHSHYIKYNDMLISYKRISSLLSTAQSILNLRFSCRHIILANINHHAEYFNVHIGGSRNLRRGRILSQLDLSSSLPLPSFSLPYPFPPLSVLIPSNQPPEPYSSSLPSLPFP